LSEENPLISNLTGFEKPLTKLIEKVADASGVLFEPTRIIRKAKAEAKAKKIHALADDEITDIQKRAVDRLLIEETKNQENIEAIISLSAPHLNEEAKPENMDNDWVRNFVDKAKIISNNDMQML